jgi:hypothetical protein
MSFGGRLAQVRAMQACNPERRAWSSAEDLDRGKESDLGDAPLAGSEHKMRPLSPRGFSRGERAGGVGPSGFRCSSTVSTFL